MSPLDRSMSKRFRRWGSGAAITCVALSGCGPTADAAGGDRPGEASVAPHPEGLYGQALPAINGVRSVVLLRPVDMSVFEPGYSEAKVDQFGLVFSPQRLIVQADRPMVFTNSEAALSHNVQVWPLGSTAPIFDSDALPEDVIEFSPQEGAYDILCDEHPGMRAFLFATHSPMAVFAEEDGAFDFGVLPEGDYVIQGWSVQSGFGPEATVSVGLGATGVDVQPSDAGPTS